VYANSPECRGWTYAIAVKKSVRGAITDSEGVASEVFSPAVKESAAAVILVHNHPTGDPAPSSEDNAITRRLKEAGEIMGIKVLDHIIVGDGAYVSFVERGLL
jgi:DNA repair protein RadC